MEDMFAFNVSAIPTDRHIIIQQKWTKCLRKSLRKVDFLWEKKLPTNSKCRTLKFESHVRTQTPEEALELSILSTLITTSNNASFNLRWKLVTHCIFKFHLNNNNTIGAQRWLFEIVCWSALQSADSADFINSTEAFFSTHKHEEALCRDLEAFSPAFALRVAEERPAHQGWINLSSIFIMCLAPSHSIGP